MNDDWRCEYCGLRYGTHIALGCPEPPDDEAIYGEEPTDKETL